MLQNLTFKCSQAYENYKNKKLFEIFRINGNEKYQNVRNQKNIHIFMEKNLDYLMLARQLKICELLFKIKLCFIILQSDNSYANSLIFIWFCPRPTKKEIISKKIVPVESRKNKSTILKHKILFQDMQNFVL